jgi:hypothetical protein
MPSWFHLNRRSEQFCFRKGPFARANPILRRRLNQVDLGALGAPEAFADKGNLGSWKSRKLRNGGLRAKIVPSQTQVQLLPNSRDSRERGIGNPRDSVQENSW